MLEIKVDIIDLIILFGAFQGLILALVFLTTKRLRKKSNSFLAILLIVFSLLNLDNISYNSFYDFYPWLICLPIFYFTLIPISLHFFVLYLIKPNYSFSRKDKIIFILPLVEFIHQLMRAIYFQFTSNFQLDGFWGYINLVNFFELIAISGTIYVILKSIQKLAAYQKSLYDNYAEVEEKNLNWLRMTLMWGLPLVAIWISVIYFDYRIEQEVMILTKMAWLGLTIMICWIGYSMIIRQGLFDSPIFGILERPNKVVEKLELSIKTDEHYTNILALLEHEKIYRDNNLNLSILSKKAGLSRGYVSQIINQKRQQNFFEFVNSFRVEEVKKEILNPQTQYLSILGIAQNAGFKSKSTFNAVFKKMTGMTPSEYRRKTHSALSSSKEIK